MSVDYEKAFGEKCPVCKQYLSTETWENAGLHAPVPDCVCGGCQKPCGVCGLTHQQFPMFKAGSFHAVYCLRALAEFVGARKVQP